MRSSRRVVRCRTHLAFWLGGNRFNGSKVIALNIFSRWRPLPSWISSQCLFGQICPIKRHRSFFPVKFGENRFNGSKVIAVCLFSRWRSPPSWISSFSHERALIHLRFVNSNLVSNFMKIGPLAQKLQRKFEILNLARHCAINWKSTSPPWSTRG